MRSFDEREGVQHVVYLHGFGSERGSDAVSGALEHTLATNHPDAILHTPRWQPAKVKHTRLMQAVELVQAFIANLKSKQSDDGGGDILLVGYSVGGLVAAEVVRRAPALVQKLLLLAPAIDNYERNFASTKESPTQQGAGWRMPDGYVDELRSGLVAARPDCSAVPTVVVHGLLASLFRCTP